MSVMEKRTLFFNARLVGAVDTWSPGWLLVDGGQIRLLGAGEPPVWPQGWLDQAVDAGGGWLLPGFIDLHVHGALGHELMDADPDGLRAMARHYAAHGVTGFLPSTWTASSEATLRAIETARSVMEQPASPSFPAGARILGVHLEGPYFNPARCGAQDANFIRRAERDEVLAWLDSGLVRLVALAPEYPENHWLIEECVRRGVTVSIGHSSASYAQVAEAVRLGARQATHTFNAMAPLGHRELGTVGGVMSFPELSCELIADNVHVAPAAQKILLAVKGVERLILVSDSIRGAGLPDGDYLLDQRPITIRNGEARLLDGTLVGSTLTLDRALRNLCAAAGSSPGELWPTASLNAARNIGLSARKGSLEVGKDADLVLLDEALEVWMTVVEGEVVYRATGA